MTAAAITELLALPTEPRLCDDDAIDAKLRGRGWSMADLVCEAFHTGGGHVLGTDDLNPFGNPDARHFLVFGQLYPLDPDDERMTNGPWLYDLMDHWAQQPGWGGRRMCTDQDCEVVLAQAAQAVTEHLGTPPERTALSSDAMVAGPALTHRIWRTPTHALILGPAADTGPYGYLTHLQLSYTPLACGPGLPAAGDEDGLAGWIATHIDW
ncbi:hypothetical protein SSOG_09031 [Streptomyces himastatinicus ATCC 53653]|uniref:Uncharacterized protein n=2 Tax=Streptomyces violaceusniger group TaxID=2839105 RepID=D9WL42_9ACTN|nr:hypothetical protein SSOG_09031 [Streptomyces himastatinicus ATCC 53653]